MYVLKVGIVKIRETQVCTILAGMMFVLVSVGGVRICSVSELTNLALRIAGSFSQCYLIKYRAQLVSFWTQFKVQCIVFDTHNKAVEVNRFSSPS